MTVVYEKIFDENEWYVIGNLLFLHLLIWGTPKVVPLLEGIAHYIYGFFVGMFFDHTISIRPWDFYDVNDNSSYQVIDFLSYMMYGPYSYFFIYFYIRLKVKGLKHIVYVIAWAALALLLEGIGVIVGLYHYNKGYNMIWSFPIYLVTLSVQLIIFHISRIKALQ